MLTRDEGNVHDKAPELGRYRQPDNMRSSTYELSGTVSTENPPGVYRLRTLSFQTAGGRFVRLHRELLDDYLASFVVEVLEEHPEHTRPTRLRFLYEE